MAILLWNMIFEDCQIKLDMSFHKTKYYFLFFFFLNAVSFRVFAQVQSYPSRIILNENKRVQELIIKAPESGGVESYKVELHLFEMDESGKIRELNQQEAKNHPQSLIPMIRYSPREFKLKAGQKQSIRFRILPTTPPKAGIYRAHIKVIPAGESLQSTKEIKAGNASGMALNLKMKLALAVPVYYHHSYKFPGVTLENVRIESATEGDEKLVKFLLQPKENQPIYGDFFIVGAKEPKEYSADDPNVLGILRGMASYGLKREVHVPLLPRGRDKKNEIPKSFKIEFRQASEEKGELLSEFNFPEVNAKSD